MVKLIDTRGLHSQTPEVLRALTEPVLPHYGAEWKSIYDDTTSKLKEVFGTKKNDVVLMPVPGQVAVETSVVNLVGRGGTGFVCVNGVFSGMIPDDRGDRRQVGRHSLEARVRHRPRTTWRAPWTARAETSQGRRSSSSTPRPRPAPPSSPSEIFRVCKKRGVLTVLDSISAFGGTEVKMDEWGIDYVIGYASKALGGVFGAQPVAIAKSSWEVAEEERAAHPQPLPQPEHLARGHPEGRFLGHPYPSSMPTSVIVALRKAVDLALKEGLQNRYKRHASAAAQLREGLTGMGLPALHRQEVLLEHCQHREGPARVVRGAQE